MARAPFQVLVIPYHILAGNEILYAVFNRSDASTDFWQGIAGGGEEGETPLEAARREAREEAGISPDCSFLPLDSKATIPVIHFRDRHLWGDDTYVIPEYSFGVEVRNPDLVLSDEHLEYRWLSCDEARVILKFDSNKNALWELDQRLKRILEKEI